NDPFVAATIAQRYATVFHTLGRYLLLLVFPYRLTHDYYYNQVPLVGWSDPVAIASVLLHAAALVVAVAQLARRTLFAYSALFYLVTLSVASNLVVTVGVTMSERFLYIPSIGFCLLAVVGVIAVSRRAARGEAAPAPRPAGVPRWAFVAIVVVGTLFA